MTEAYYSPHLGKKIQSDIIYHAQPLLVYDKMSIAVSSDKGVYEYMKMNSKNNLEFKPLGPGAHLENDVLKFTKTPITIDEDGIAPRIPMSTIDDSNIDLIPEITKELGRSYAKKLNSDFLTTANSGVSESESPDVKWNADNATPFVDLMKLQTLLNNEDYVMSAVATNPKSRYHLIVDPDYMVQAPKSKEQVEGYNATDPIPVLGAQVYNTTQQTAGTILAVDKDMFTLSINRNPLTVDIEKEPGARQLIINAWLRHEFAVIRDKAGATLTNVI